MKLSKEKQTICAEALKIANSDDRWTFLQERDVSGQDLWLYKRDYQTRDTALTRSRRHKTRKQALMRQGNRCGLCSAPITLGPCCCLDKTGKIVCRPCNQALVSWRRARASGISEADMVAFDA